MTTTRISYPVNSSGKGDAMRKREYIYIAVKLHKDKAPEIKGAFRNEADANKAAYSGEGWGNVIKQEVK